MLGGRSVGSSSIRVDGSGQTLQGTVEMDFVHTMGKLARVSQFLEF